MDENVQDFPDDLGDDYESGDAATRCAVAIMALPWARGEDEDEHGGRFGEVQMAIVGALADYPDGDKIAEMIGCLDPGHGLCPFCRRDPYEYVNNGVGYERVAVSCCDQGISLFQYGDEELAKDAQLRRDAAAALISLSARVAEAQIEMDAAIARAEKAEAELAKLSGHAKTA